MKLNAGRMFCILILLVWLSSLRKGIRNLFSPGIFILIRNGNDKRTTNVRCFSDSLMKSHASLDSHKASMWKI